MENNNSNNAQNFFSRQTGKHLLGYSFIGAMSNSIEIGLLFLFVEVFNIYYLGASTAVFIAGSIITFIGRKFFVFKDKNLKNIPRQFAKYIFIFLIGVVLNFFIMKTFVEVLKVHYAVAYITSILFTGIIGFLWNKKITFKN
jgi:putative flippase GtrA